MSEGKFKPRSLITDSSVEDFYPGTRLSRRKVRVEFLHPELPFLAPRPPEPSHLLPFLIRTCSQRPH